MQKITYWLHFHSRRLPCSPMPGPQAPCPHFTQSNPNLFIQQHHCSSEVRMLQCQSPAHHCAHSQAAALNECCSGTATPGKQTVPRPTHQEGSTCRTLVRLNVWFSHAAHSRSSPAGTCTPPNQKSKVKKKMPKTSAYRRDIQGGKQTSSTHSHC